MLSSISCSIALGCSRIHEPLEFLLVFPAFSHYQPSPVDGEYPGENKECSEKHKDSEHKHCLAPLLSYAAAAYGSGTYMVFKKWLPGRMTLSKKMMYGQGAVESGTSVMNCHIRLSFESILNTLFFMKSTVCPFLSSNSAFTLS